MPSATPSAVLRLTHRIRRRLYTEAWLAAAVLPSWAAASVSLLVRVAMPSSPAWLVAAPWPLALAFWITLMWRRRTSITRAAVLADQAAGAHGLLLTSFEEPLGGWAATLLSRTTSAQPPAARITPHLMRMLPAWLLLGLAAWMPASDPTSRGARGAAAALAAIEEQLDLLVRLDAVDPALREELQTLEDALDEAPFTAEDWQATDALAQALRQSAAEAAQALSRAERAASAVEEAMRRGDPPAAVEKRQKELSDAMHDLKALGRADQSGRENGAAQETPAGRGSSPAGGAAGDAGAAPDGAGAPTPSAPPRGRPQLGEGGGGAGQPHPPMNGNGKRPRTPEQAGNLRRDLGARQRRLAQQFGMGIAPPTSPGSAAGPPTPAGPQPQQSPPGAKDGAPGQGGTSRGGGPSELWRQAPGPPLLRELTLERLPPGSGRPRELLGIRTAEPLKERAGKAKAAGGVAPGDAAAGTLGPPLLPDNQDLVKRYFEAKPRK